MWRGWLDCLPRWPSIFTLHHFPSLKGCSSSTEIHFIRKHWSHSGLYRVKHWNFPFTNTPIPNTTLLPKVQMDVCKALPSFYACIYVQIQIWNSKNHKWNHITCIILRIASSLTPTHLPFSLQYVFGALSESVYLDWPPFDKMDVSSVI